MQNQAVTKMYSNPVSRELAKRASSWKLSFNMTHPKLAANDFRKGLSVEILSTFGVDAAQAFVAKHFDIDQFCMLAKYIGNHEYFYRVSGFSNAIGGLTKFEAVAGRRNTTKMVGAMAFVTVSDDSGNNATALLNSTGVDLDLGILPVVSCST